MVVGAVAQKWVPMRRWSGVLGEAGEVPGSWRGRTVRGIPERAGDDAERDVAVAVDRAMAHLPGTPSCLAQAFAGQVMLRRRGRGGVVVIGLRRGRDDRDVAQADGADPGIDVAPGSADRGTPPARSDLMPAGQGQWDAHAWLLGSVGALTGGPAASGFTATTVFEAPGGLRADEVVLDEGY